MGQPNNFEACCEACGQLVPAYTGVVKRGRKFDGVIGRVMEKWYVYCGDRAACESRAPLVRDPGQKYALPPKTWAASPAEGFDPGMPNRFKGKCGECNVEVAAQQGRYRYKTCWCVDCDRRKHGHLTPDSKLPGKPGQLYPGTSVMP